jgi:hypothetical protein
MIAPKTTVCGRSDHRELFALAVVVFVCSPIVLIRTAAVRQDRGGPSTGEAIKGTMQESADLMRAKRIRNAPGAKWNLKTLGAAQVGVT